jgi:ABC-type oligopeptide transport system ATPase subunit
VSISLSDMLSRLTPEKTILFLGAGSSVPSGAPSVSKIIETVARQYSISPDGYSLSEITGIAEDKSSRRDLISTVRSLFKNLDATGALLNLPLYPWKNIYTTNYDNLIEQAYKRLDLPISVYTCNFDFKMQEVPEAIKLYKLHGTIDKDISDGNHSRIIISEADNDSTSEYREILYDTLKNDLNSASLLIVGYSLADDHIKDIVARAIQINSKCFSTGPINLLLYSRDEDRAHLFERRGIKVAFGGLDDLFIQLEKHVSPRTVYSSSGDPLDCAWILRNVTTDVAHEIENTERNASAMFQGWPASYGDIKAGLTFERSQVNVIENIIEDENNLCAVILGASGTGKSTLARQVIAQLHEKKYLCWEHKVDHTLLAEQWRDVARNIQKNSQKAAFFVDDAHLHLSEINKLIDLLVSEDLRHFKVILAAPRNQWNPRIKTPNLFKRGKSITLRKLDLVEIEKLLTLVDTNADLQPLVESSFSGFSRNERKRRLVAKCEADTFVCLKNIFASEKFDDIVLREFAELEPELRDIYKLVSAMESSGINVHRQLVIRLLGIPADNISAALTKMLDIIHEYTVSEREGIYGWRGRHQVITDIITKYKMSDYRDFYTLFENVIDNLLPTYDIEIRTIRQLCAFQSGISRIPDKHLRNKLLRKMISVAPGERVPRHRLIRYLIDINELEKAETEIRLYEHDFRVDGPVQRYKIILMLTRAEKTAGILDEDRKAILEMAREQAVNAVDKYRDNKDILRTYCDVGIAFFKRTGDRVVINEAMAKLREAEERIGDPDITSIIVRYERMVAGYDFEYNIEDEEAS